MKCPGCRCSAPTTDRRCGCCGAWPDSLACIECGHLGRFDEDLLRTVAGPIHDDCHAQREARERLEENVREHRDARRYVRT